MAKGKYKPLVLLIITFLIGLYGHSAEVLTVAFNSKPPFFYMEDGIAKGELVVRAQKIFSSANVKIEFQEIPFLRIIEFLKAKKKNFVALGFSKTAEREEFVNFTLPIYRDETPILVVRKEDEPAFKKFSTLKEMISESTFSFGGKSGNSYPIDELLKPLGPRDHRFSQEALKLPELLIKGRFDFMLLYPNEFVTAKNLDPNLSHLLRPVSYPDIPMGGFRYLLFSKAVPEITVQKINKQIKKLYPELKESKP